MSDAMMNGGFAPYLAQALTPQGVPGGLFGGGIGNVPGNVFHNPMLGNISPFTTNPPFGGWAVVRPA
jgi:hypothetical protein